MYSADYQRVAEGGMAVITKLQNYRHEEQALALALVFLKVTEKFNVRPADVLEAAGRIFEKESFVCPELRAMAMYVEKEI